MPCDHNPVTIFPNGFTYIAINGEQVMTLGAVSLVAHTSGVLPIDRGGTGATTPEQARINLGLGDGGLTAVEDDPAPKLGGNLSLAGHRIMVTDALDAFHGALGYSPTVGALFLSENMPGEYFEDKAGVSFHAGLLALHGSRTQVKALVGAGNREVWVDPDGGLYPVEPAPPAWDVEDQSTGKIGAYGDVSGTGAWTKIPNLSVLTEQPVNQGDAVGATTRAYINNLSSVGGDLEFGWGIGTAEPAAGAGTSTVAVVTGQRGYVTANHYQEALASLPAGTEVVAWVRALGPPEFGPWIDGGLGYPHYLTVEAVGSAAGSDVIVSTDRTVYVEVTGNDTTGDGVSVGTAYATVQKAINSIQGWIILSPATVTIQLGAGDFTSASVITFSHPYGSQVKLLGQTPTNQITGIVEADFTNPLAPVPGVRGTWALYNSAGMLAVTADATARTAARTQDKTDNEALLRTVYATRIINSGAEAAAITFSSSCADFGNVLCNKEVAITVGRLNCSGSYAVVNGQIIAATRGASAVISKGISCGATSYGISVETNAFVRCTTLLVQGGNNHGVHITSDGMLEVNDATISGCKASGIHTASFGRFVTLLPTNVVRRISVTGCESHQTWVESGGLIGFSGGAAGSMLNLGGSKGNELYASDGGVIYVTPDTVTVKIQSAVVNVGYIGIRAQTQASIMLDGPVEINSGYYGLRAHDAGKIHIAAAITFTNPGVSVISAEQFGVISINGAITAAAGLGSTGITATTGSQVLDAGNVLSALAATYPTKFTPTFGKTLADGSAITGGPVGTAGLLMTATAVTLGGSSLKADALAGTGSRAVMAAADGTLTATTLLSAMAGVMSSGIPTSETSPGNVGEVHADADNIYLCTAPNFWRRVSLKAW